MRNPKTRFEQVPLEVVRKIVEEQDRQVAATGFAIAVREGICQKQSSQKPR
jgi:hypothetical protein